jgi:hypothetical protein
MPEEPVEEDDELSMPDDAISPETEKQVNEAEAETQGQPDDIFNNVLEPENDETLEPNSENDENDNEEEFDFDDEDLNMEEADEDLNIEEEPKKEEKKIVKKPVIKESTIIKNQISEYFNAEVKYNSAIKDIKTKILESSSLSEAVTKINKFKESLKNKKNDSPVKFSENKNKKPAWLEGGRL